MKTCAPAILAAVLAGPAAPAVAGGLRATFEAGPAWQTRNDFRIPGDAGSLVRLADVDSGPASSWRGTLSWEVKERQSIRLLAAPLRLRTRFVPTSSLVFQDRAFDAGAATEASYRFDSYRVTWSRGVARRGRFDLRLGATLKVRSASIGLRQGASSSVKKNVGPVPLLHVSASYRAGDRAWLELEADALAAPQGRAEDVSLKGVYRVSDRVALDVGYRLLEGGADNDEVFTFATFHYVVAGVRLKL